MAREAIPDDSHAVLVSAFWNVRLEHILAVVAIATGLTDKGLFSEVAPLVVAHITLGSEAFAAALGADKGAFVTVNSYMNLQILLLAKGF